MGNQLPSRCMVPCNPQCCALCIHGDLGKADEEEYNATQYRQRASGGVFANAAAVLTAGAEDAVVNERRDGRDLSSNDLLERELANEVELWRMDTVSTAVHMMVHADATKGMADVAVLGGTTATAVDSMPFAHARRTSSDRSVSPPLRMQVSLHDRVGVSHSHAADPFSANAKQFAFGSMEDKRPCGDDPAGFGCSGSRGATTSTACEEPCNVVTEEGVVATKDCVADSVTHTAAPASEAAEAGKRNSLAAGSPVRRNGLESQGTLNSMFHEGLPDTREVEAMSSSDESTFAGFIEDPYEQQRAAEVYSWIGDSPNSQRATAAYSLASESPAPNLRALSSLSENVRPDRSPYF